VNLDLSSNLRIYIVNIERMPSCCVPGCDKRGTSLHRLPTDDAIRSEWVKVLGINQSLVRPVVCSAHFEDEDFRSVVRG